MKLATQRQSAMYEKEYTYNLFEEDDLGRTIYLSLCRELGSAKKASEILNEHGIKGITYDGRRDGRCYVVFDDKAISIIERYNQSVRGQTQIGGMSRVVNLFESADKSTFDDPDGNSSVNGRAHVVEMKKKLYTIYKRLYDKIGRALAISLKSRK